MTQKLTAALALTAGFFGGILSQYVTPMLVHAQASAPVKIEAQSLQFVDQSGEPQGGFVAMDGRLYVSTRDRCRPGLAFRATEFSGTLRLPSQGK